MRLGETERDYLNRRFTEITLMQNNTIVWESLPRREREKPVENPLDPFVRKQAIIV